MFLISLCKNDSGIKGLVISQVNIHRSDLLAMLTLSWSCAVIICARVVNSLIVLKWSFQHGARIQMMLLSWGAFEFCFMQLFDLAMCKNKKQERKSFLGWLKTINKPKITIHTYVTSKWSEDCNTCNAIRVCKVLKMLAKYKYRYTKLHQYQNLTLVSVIKTISTFSIYLHCHLSILHELKARIVGAWTSHFELVSNNFL